MATTVQIVQPTAAARLMGLVRPLDQHGHDAWLTGESLAELMLGHAPQRLTLETTARAEEISSLFERAVPIGPAGVAWRIATPEGPIDCLPRLKQNPQTQNLARRGLTLFAMAWWPLRNHLEDPFGGQADLAAQRLRLIDPAHRPLARDPGLAFSILKRVGLRGEKPDAPCEQALGELRIQDLDRIPSPWRGTSLRMLFDSPHLNQVIDLLQSTQLERGLGVQSSPDTSTLIQQSPQDAALALSIWLRGARAGRFLRRHRFERQFADRVLRLLRAHPLDENFSPRKRPSLVRLAALPTKDREALFRLRTLELKQGPRTETHDAAIQHLQRLQTALAEHQEREFSQRESPALNLDGSEVMEALGIDAGPLVGRALAYLKKQIAVSPELNEPAALHALLQRWKTDDFVDAPNVKHETMP